MQVFAKPEHEQEDEVLLYSMMFLVIAVGSAISWSLMVCMSFMVDHDIICYSSMAELIFS